MRHAVKILFPMDLFQRTFCRTVAFQFYDHRRQIGSIWKKYHICKTFSFRHHSTRYIVPFSTRIISAIRRSYVCSATVRSYPRSAIAALSSSCSRKYPALSSIYSFEPNISTSAPGSYSSGSSSCQFVSKNPPQPHTSYILRDRPVAMGRMVMFRLILLL